MVCSCILRDHLYCKLYQLYLVAVAGLLVPDFIYNIGTTVLNGGVSMIVFFFVNKVIFPETPKQIIEKVNA